MALKYTGQKGVRMIYQRVFQKARRRYYFHAYLFIAPAIIVFLLFRLYPALSSFVYAFTEVHILKSSVTFVGLSNFQELRDDPLFLRSVVNTGIYGMTIVPISLIGGGVLAYLLHNIIRFKEVFKAIYFLPVVTSGVASALIWKWLYNPKFGPFNRLLNMAGFPTFRWLHYSREAIFAVIIFVMWRLSLR